MSPENMQYVTHTFSVNPINAHDFYQTTDGTLGNFVTVGVAAGATQTGTLIYNIPQGNTALLRNVFWDWNIIYNSTNVVTTKVILITDDIAVDLKGDGFLEYSNGLVPVFAYAYRYISLIVVRTNQFNVANGVFNSLNDRFNAIFNGNLIPNANFAVNESITGKGSKYATG